MWTAPAYVDGLVTALKARAGLAGIDISTGPIPRELVRTQAIAVVAVMPSAQDPADIGPPTNSRSMEERYTIVGGIIARALGKGEPIIKAARDSAAAMLEEIDQAVRADFSMGINEGVGGDNPVTVAFLSRKEMDQGIEDKYRWCSIGWAIDVTARH